MTRWILLEACANQNGFFAHCSRVSRVKTCLSRWWWWRFFTILRFWKSERLCRNIKMIWSQPVCNVEQSVADLSGQRLARAVENVCTHVQSLSKIKCSHSEKEQNYNFGWGEMLPLPDLRPNGFQLWSTGNFLFFKIKFSIDKHGWLKAATHVSQFYL